MNTIILSKEEWLLTDQTGTTYPFSGTDSERVAALTAQLQQMEGGGIVSESLVFTNEEGTFSLDQWLTEKLNRPFVCTTKEQYEEKVLKFLGASNTMATPLVKMNTRWSHF